MKLRLTQPGFESYTGQMGVVFFEDGLSTADVLPIDAVRISAVMQSTWEDGSTSSVAQSILDNQDTPAPTEQATAPVGNETAPVVEGVPYTEEELGAIADAEGINGLRQLATPLGIKGNSVAALIAALVKAGARKAE